MVKKIRIIIALMETVYSDSNRSSPFQRLIHMGKTAISLFGQLYPYKSRNRLLFIPKPFPLKWRGTIPILTAPFHQKNKVLYCYSLCFY
jgi:hypothetical protein